VSGEGPRLTPTLADGALDQLTAYPARLDPVYETVRKVRAALDPQKTLIGFAGSPWTVATYMIAGEGSREQAQARRLAYADPARFGEILGRIEEVTLDYLSARSKRARRRSNCSIAGRGACHRCSSNNG
jgi:uroporphyrinogen decarboxylase